MRGGYPTPQAPADLVLADLTGVIDALCPAHAIPDPLDWDAAAAPPGQ